MFIAVIYQKTGRNETFRKVTTQSLCHAYRKELGWILDMSCPVNKQSKWQKLKWYHSYETLRQETRKEANERKPKTVFWCSVSQTNVHVN